MPLPPTDTRLTSSRVGRSIVSTSDTPSPTPFVLAKLIKHESFRRGTFVFLDNGVTVRHVTIVTADKADKANIPDIGTIYYITDYPTDSKGKLAPNDFDGRPNYLDRRSNKMHAHELTEEADETDGMDSVPPTELIDIIKAIVGAFIDPFKNSKDGKTPQFQKAPRNLEDAIKKLRAGNPDRTRSINKNSVSKRLAGRGPADVKQPKVISGAYIEKSENGITLSANNKGVIVDNKGNVVVQGEFKNNQFGTQRPSMGMDSFANPVSDVQPKTVVTPMFMGPLALDRIPNFNIINWAFKLFQAFNAVSGIIFAETGKESKLRKKSAKITESETEQGEAESSDKNAKSGVMKILDKIPFP